jgi:hypothetical protein
MSTPARTLPLPPPTAWDRYQPWRRPVEIGFWVALYLFNATANTATVWMDIRRLHLGFSAWEPAVWEWSSALVALALIPGVVWFTRKVPLHFDTWKRALPLHLLGSLAWSALHVAGMVALREAALLRWRAPTTTSAPGPRDSSTSTSRTCAVTPAWWSPSRLPLAAPSLAG